MRRADTQRLSAAVAKHVKRDWAPYADTRCMNSYHENVGRILEDGTNDAHAKVVERCSDLRGAEKGVLVFVLKSKPPITQHVAVDS